MLRMEEYYKVLHFLEFDGVDRIYPCESYFLNDEGKPISYTGDLLWKTNRETFSGIDYVTVLLESNNSFSTSDLRFELSEYLQGYSPVLVLDAEDDVIIPENTPTKVVFKLKKSQQMVDSSRNLTGIRSCQLIAPDENDYVIHEICFRNDNTMYTLEQLDRFIENGKYYIASRLHITEAELPFELKDHVYTAAAGYAWLSVWEFEARIMNDEQKNAKSYGKWLFAEVDQAIADYKEMKGIADDDELFVRDELVTYTESKW